MKRHHLEVTIALILGCATTHLLAAPTAASKQNMPMLNQKVEPQTGVVNAKYQPATRVPASPGGIGAHSGTRATGLPARENSALNNKPGLNEQASARAAQNLKQLDQLRQAEQAHSLFGRENATHDPAGGTALGGKGLDVSGHGYNQAQGQGFNRGDCLANPADCLSRQRPGGSASDRMMAGPQSAAPQLNGGREQASDGYGWTIATARGGADIMKNGFDGKKDGAGSVIPRVIFGAPVLGIAIVSVFEAETLVNIVTSPASVHPLLGVKIPDPAPATPGTSNRPDSGGAEPDTSNSPDSGGADPDGPAEQPGVHDGSVGSVDNCDWTPLQGCRNKRDVRTSIRQMTVRPAEGEGADTGTGSGAPRIGLAAVSNPGDGSWSVGRNGNGGGGRPLDMRDPSTGGEDGEPVPRGGFAPR